MPMTPCEQCHSRGEIHLMLEALDSGVVLPAMDCPLCRGEGELEITPACDLCGDRNDELLVAVGELLVSHWYHPPALRKLALKLSVA